MLATMLPSHADDDAAGVTWLRCNVDDESYWRRHCRGDLAAVQCRCQVMLATALPGRLGHGKVAQPLRLEHRGVVAS
jgi:hypothetical protein